MSCSPPSPSFSTGCAPTAVDATPVLPAAPAVAAGRRWSSRDLLAGAREIEIEHEGSVYRLRLTALGKLILTK
ncbi:MAG: hemin uptake protein HemP [Leptothrix sp. (in: b-proteobacteria)]